MKIEEGYTLDFLVHAFFTGVSGLVLLYLCLNEFDYKPFFDSDEIVWAFPAAVLLMAISVLMILVKSGVEISTEDSKIRIYKAIFNQKIGLWIELDDVASANVELTHESQHLMSRGTEQTYVTKTFDLFFINKSGKKTKIHSFTNRKLALETLQRLKTHFQIPSADHTKGNHKSRTFKR